MVWQNTLTSAFKMTLYTNILWLLPKDFTLQAVPMLLWRENLELALLLVPRHRVAISTSLWNTKRKCIRVCVRACVCVCDEHAKVCKTKRPRSAEKKIYHCNNKGSNKRFREQKSIRCSSQQMGVRNSTTKKIWSELPSVQSSLTSATSQNGMVGSYALANYQQVALLKRITDVMNATWCTDQPFKAY